jgi:hypothetical protein
LLRSLTGRPSGRAGWLVAIVLAATVIEVLLTWSQHSIVLFPDELIYGELGRSLAASGDFAIRGVPAHSYPPLYPTLLAPLYAAFDDLGHVHRAVLVVNALLMALAAVPTYLLARRVTQQSRALVAAALTVAVPSLGYSRFVMTESLFYVLFVSTAYALFLVLEVPTLRRQVALMAVLAAAGLTRFQAVALAPAIVTAIVLVTLADGPGRRSRLRRYWPIWAVLSAGASVLVAVQLFRGKGLLAPPPSYSGLRHDYGAGDVARWVVYHLADIDLYVGIVPFFFVALAMLHSFGRAVERRLRILVAVTFALTTWTLLSASAFASFAGYLEERYVFYVAPLFFVVFAAAAGRITRQTSWGALLALAAGSVALPALLPERQFELAPIGPQALALRPFARLETEIGIWPLRVVLVLAASAVVAAAIVLAPRARAPVLGVAIFLLSVHGYVEKTLHAPVWSGSKAGATTWVDRRVGTHAQVALLHAGLTDYPSIFRTEFFNRSVGPVYNLGRRFWFADVHVRIASRGNLVQDGGAAAVPARYVVADGSFQLAGSPLARQQVGALTLYATSGPVRLTGLVTGLQQPLFTPPRGYSNLGWSGARFALTHYDCSGGSATIELRANPFIGTRTQRLTVVGRAGIIRLQAGERRKVTLPLRATKHLCRLEFRVYPLVSPDRAVGNGDVRSLGVRVVGFRFAD